MTKEHYMIGFNSAMIKYKCDWTLHEKINQRAKALVNMGIIKK
jgi:hypothetical protein